MNGLEVKAVKDEKAATINDCEERMINFFSAEILLKKAKAKL